MANEPNPEPLVRVRDAAAITGLPAWRIKRWAYAGKFPSFKPEGRNGLMWVYVSDIRSFIEQHRHPAA